MGNNSTFISESDEAYSGVTLSGTVSVSDLDRESSESNMGYVVLVKGQSFKTQVERVSGNTIFEIRYNFDLGGETVEIPEGCTLKFEGGSLYNGTINGERIHIESTSENIFGEDLAINLSKTEVHTKWFGYTTSAINKCIESFAESTVVIDPGEYSHDATVTIPYDTKVVAENVLIKMLTALTVFEIYADYIPLYLRGINIHVADNASGDAIKLKGHGWSAIRGYRTGTTTDIKTGCDNLPLMMPFITGTSQTFPTTNTVTGVRIIVGANSNNSDYLYYKNIDVSCQNMTNALYIDCVGGSYGVITVNTYNVTCWWCVNGVVQSKPIGGQGVFNVWFQCNSHTEKIVKVISQSGNLSQSDVIYNLYPYDTHLTSSTQTLVDNYGCSTYNIVNVGSVRLTGGGNLLANKLRDKTSLDNFLRRLSSKALATGTHVIDDGVILEKILTYYPDGTNNPPTTHRGCIAKLIDYFNTGGELKDVRLEAVIGYRFNNSSVIGRLMRFFDEEEPIVSRCPIMGKVVVELMVPYTSASSVSNANWTNCNIRLVKVKFEHFYPNSLSQLNNSTLSDREVIYRVNYASDGTTVDNLTAYSLRYFNEKVDTFDAAKPPQSTDNEPVFFKNIGKNLRYNYTEGIYVDDNNVTLGSISTVDDLKSLKILNANARYQIGNTLYTIKTLGTATRFRFTMSAVPTGVASVTFTFGEDSYTITVPDYCKIASYEDFYNVVKERLNRTNSPVICNSYGSGYLIMTHKSAGSVSNDVVTAYTMSYEPNSETVTINGSSRTAGSANVLYAVEMTEVS